MVNPNPSLHSFGEMSSGIGEPVLQVLVVEDNPVEMMLIVAMLEQVLERKGVKFSIIERPGGAEGLSAFESGDFGIVLTDRDMKPVDGLEMVKGIRARIDKGQPFVIMHSARPDGEAPEEHAKLAEDAGVDALLDKMDPEKAKTLSSLIDVYLRQEGRDPARNLDDPTPKDLS